MKLDGLTSNHEHINKALIAESASKGNILDILARFSIGDIIKAKVTEISGNKLILNLADGTALKAAHSPGVNFKEGQTVYLTVVKKTDRQLFVETLFERSDKSLKSRGHENQAADKNGGIHKNIETAGGPKDIETGARAHDANYAYIQIPLDSGESGKLGDFYILKRNRGGRSCIDPENMVMLLSLHLENIKHVDLIISVNKKNISLYFKLQDKAIIDFVKENYRDLYKSLLHKGYKVVDVKYRLNEYAIDDFYTDDSNINDKLKKVWELIDNDRRDSIDFRV